jgi:hypothetical protein
MAGGFSVEVHELEPSVVEEFAKAGVGGEDGIAELGLAIDDDGKVAQFVDERRAVVDGLERETDKKQLGA